MPEATAQRGFQIARARLEDGLRERALQCEPVFRIAGGGGGVQPALRIEQMDVRCAGQFLRQMQIHFRQEVGVSLLRPVTHAKSAAAIRPHPGGDENESDVACKLLQLRYELLDTRQQSCRVGAFSFEESRELGYYPLRTSPHEYRFRLVCLRPRQGLEHLTERRGNVGAVG